MQVTIMKWTFSPINNKCEILFGPTLKIDILKNKYKSIYFLNYATRQTRQNSILIFIYYLFNWLISNKNIAIKLKKVNNRTFLRDKRDFPPSYCESLDNCWEILTLYAICLPFIESWRSSERFAERPFAV